MVTLFFGKKRNLEHFSHKSFFSLI